jgi:peptidoglycan hydrolase-like protein with peptidoglycan-binding domain
MISQALSRFSPTVWLARTGAIACLGLLSLGLHPSAQIQAQSQAQSQAQTSPTTRPSTGQPSERSQPTPAETAIPDSRPILNQGSQGESVSELQALLKLLGFYSGAVDGIYRDNTASAVAAFQQSAGLQSDGIVGAETWTRLLPPSPTTTSSPAATSAPAVPANNTSNVASSPAASVVSNPTTSFPSPTGLPSLSPSPAGTPSPAAATPTPSPATPTPSPATPQTEAAPTTPTPSSPSTTVDLPLLRIGMRGSAVSGLQERLKAIGLFNGAIDGVFGAETQEAVKAAQRNFNLEADGIVGPATWLALLR